MSKEQRGVFIASDDALTYAAYVEMLLNTQKRGEDTGREITILEGLVAKLRSCKQLEVA